jgi:hypothetical protein
MVVKEGVCLQPITVLAAAQARPIGKANGLREVTAKATEIADTDVPGSTPDIIN